MPEDLVTPMPVRDILVRSVEAVAWVDPSEIMRLDDRQLRDLLPTGLYVTVDSLPAWREAVRGLLRARIPVEHLVDVSPGGDDGQGWLEPSAQRLADELALPASEVRLGNELRERLTVSEDGPLTLERQIAAVVDALWARLGVPFPAPQPVLATELAPWSYEIVVHGLVRASGAIQEHSSPLAEWIDPRSGILVDAPRRDEPATFESHLALQVGACLEEAAAEFVDLTWTEEHLDRLAKGAGELVAVVRSLIADDVLATVLAQLARERRMLSGPAVLERLLEAGSQPAVELVLDDAEADAALGWVEDADDVSGLVELARTSAPRGAAPEWTVPLGDEIVSALRAADGGATAMLLREVADVATSHPEGDGALVVPLDLRPVIDRLVRAQHPALHVMTVYELPESRPDGHASP